MDANRFDQFAKTLSAASTRRGVLGFLSTLPFLGGLAALIGEEETDAKGRRKRRKKSHKHGKGRRKKSHKHGKGRHKGKHKKQKCKPKSKTTTCQGKCGSVKNNCKKTVNCGSCDCEPACETCFTCQGAVGQPGACVPASAGTACGDAASCAGGTVTPQGSCDGSGTCEPGSPVSCAPYTQCDGDACATRCADDDDCVAGSFCNDDEQCVGDAPDGQPCDHGGQCASGFCVDDICCNIACDGDCEACNVSGNVGTCTTEADGTNCGGQNICCTGSCQECCTDAQCSGDTPICDDGACVACSAEHPCPSGCCDAATGACVGNCPSCQTCDGGVCVADPSQHRDVCAGSGTTSICCNGTCWDGCCDGAGEPGACRVFATSTTYDGNLGGLDGAAATCQARALAGDQPGGDVPGSYQAWLSDDTGSPSTRFRRSARPYRLPNGAEIASSYADLVAGPGLDTALDRTELGGQVPAGHVAWTNTRHDGTPGGTGSHPEEICPNYPTDLHCTNWGSTAGDGNSGDVDAATCRWTAELRGGCATAAVRHLYCFQQD